MMAQVRMANPVAQFQPCLVLLVACKTFFICALFFGSVVSGKTCPLRLTTSQPVTLNEIVSSSVLNLTNVKSPLDCALMCLMMSCAVASLNDVSRLCQLIVLNDASRGAGPPGTHVRRVVGAAFGDRVWKAADFEAQLRNNTMNISMLLLNSSTGGNGTVQSAVVPVSGCYRIEAAGAGGGIASGIAGSRGARMSGKFSLTSGTQLSVIVGQRGGNSVSGSAGSGGGGGTFVYKSADSFLLLAAGGGGGSAFFTAGTLGQAGVINVAAAYIGYYFGGAGAGWLGKCNVTQRTLADALSGGSRADGWVGGIAGSGNGAAVGGFGGGGGGGGSNFCGGAGGGGGFSGGGAGVSCHCGGGGGGSFCSGSGCNGTTGGNKGSDQGSVAIELMAFAC